MLNLFNRRKWTPDVVPEVIGSCGDLEITIRNLPCLRVADTDERKYPYAGFGQDFLSGLIEQLGAFKFVSETLRSGSPAHAYVRVRSYSPIDVKLRGKASRTKDQFESDVADSVIEAFKTIQLRP